MTSEVCLESEKQTSLGATSTEILRPALSTRSQLPVPMNSSRTSPTKTFPSTKLSDKAPNNGGVNVQVEMERQVKVEVVKQVTVDCTVQERCESSFSGMAPCPNDPKAPDAGSSPVVVSSALNRKSLRQLSSPSKVDVTAAKLVLAQSISSSIASSPHKEKSETDRSSSTSSPSVGVQRTTRKGIARQLPGADLIKRPNQKESVDGKNSCGSPIMKDLQTLHRPAVFTSKLPENGKSVENGRSALKICGPSSKSSSGSVSSRIAKTTVSVDSSNSTNVSSSLAGRALIKRPLRYGQPPANLIPRLERRSLVQGSVKKTNVESDSLSNGTKSKIPGENRRLEKPQLVTKNARKLNVVDQGLRKLQNLRSILPKKKQGLLSVVEKVSRSSSRRTSNSSVSCSSRSEILPRGSALVENSQSETAPSKHGKCCFIPFISTVTDVIFILFKRDFVLILIFEYMYLENSV